MRAYIHNGPYGDEQVGVLANPQHTSPRSPPSHRHLYDDYNINNSSCHGNEDDDGNAPLRKPTITTTPTTPTTDDGDKDDDNDNDNHYDTSNNNTDDN